MKNLSHGDSQILRITVDVELPQFMLHDFITLELHYASPRLPLRIQAELKKILSEELRTIYAQRPFSIGNEDASFANAMLRTSAEMLLIDTGHDRFKDLIISEIRCTLTVESFAKAREENQAIGEWAH